MESRLGVVPDRRGGCSFEDEPRVESVVAEDWSTLWERTDEVERLLVVGCLSMKAKVPLEVRRTLDVKVLAGVHRWRVAT